MLDEIQGTFEIYDGVEDRQNRDKWFLSFDKFLTFGTIGICFQGELLLVEYLSGK